MRKIFIYILLLNLLSCNSNKNEGIVIQSVDRHIDCYIGRYNDIQNIDYNFDDLFLEYDSLFIEYCLFVRRVDSSSVDFNPDSIKLKHMVHPDGNITDEIYIKGYIGDTVTEVCKLINKWILEYEGITLNDTLYQNIMLDVRYMLINKLENDIIFYIPTHCVDFLCSSRIIDYPICGEFKLR